MRPIHRVDSIRWEGGLGRQGQDLLAVEEPLEIRLNGQAVAVTMRTPGHDFPLAAGFLYTEGILKEARQVGSIARCSNSEKGSADNVVDVLTSPQAPRPEEGWQRRFYLSSSCGICGRSSIDAVRQALPPLTDSSRFDPEILYTFGPAARCPASFQRDWALRRRSVHPAGELQGIMEDVGRHNAVDKIIGARPEDGILREHVLLVSGGCPSITQSTHGRNPGPDRHLGGVEPGGGSGEGSGNAAGRVSTRAEHAGLRGFGALCGA
jgi:FdhD protein